MSIRHDVLRRLRNPRGAHADRGWAGHSLERSVNRGLLISMATMQVVTGLAALSSLELQTAGIVLATAHLVAAGVALAALRFGRGYWTLILGTWVLFIADWTLSPVPESTLLFAACWMRNLNDALSTFLLRGSASWRIPVSAAAVLPLLMIVARPDLATNPLVPAVASTLIAITVAARIGISYLIDYTDGVDAEARALQATMASLTTRKSARLQAAEDARVLHDTAINTLGAIANGGAAVTDRQAVRKRCLDDIAAIEDLRSLKRDDGVTRPGLRDAIRPTGIQVRYAGMPEDEIARTEALLPPPVMRALGRAVAEAVQNAAKHSGADEVLVSIDRTSAGVRVAVSDKGAGMQPTQRYGAGIAQSILARTLEAGIRATIDSARGQGTTVTLEYDFDDARDPPHASDTSAGNVEDLVRQLRSYSAFALSAGLVGVGVALSALNHPGEATPEWLMVAVVAVACGLAWRERNRARLSAATAIALMTAGPLAFVLSAWSVGFGRADPYLWQAIAPTGPLLALTIVLLPRAVKMLGFAAYLLTVAATAAYIAPASLEAASITTVAGLVGLGMVWAVTSFVRSLAEVATRANGEQRKAFTAGLELAAVEAAAVARRRWREAGLDQSVSLLRAIGEGRADPGDPAVRNRCAEEEAFLRQLSLLNPDLIQMGAWFARALNASRVKGVGLTVRAGAADATADDAPRFGRMLLTVVDAMPAGTKLTAAFFATNRGLAMTLVAPTPHLISTLSSDGHRDSILKLQTFGAQDLAEVVVAGA